MKKLITNWISNVKELRAHIVIYTNGELFISPATLSAYRELLRSGWSLNELLRLNMGTMFVTLGLAEGSDKADDIMLKSVLALTQGAMNMEEFMVLLNDCVNKG